MDSLFLHPWFRIDALNGFVAGAIGLFFILTVVYSFKFMKGRADLIQYYIYLALTAIVSLGAVLANNLILLLVCWGFLGLLLYLLINMGDEGAAQAAKKALVIVGGADCLMILGVAIIYFFTQTFQINEIKMSLDSGLAVFAYLCIAIGCFAKAGAVPFHTWIPDCARSAPLPVTAYLPASLDKLLGIYLLARLSLDLFVMNQAMNNFLMFAGAATIISAVMMALVQHDLKRLLGYHAVSQVGYMVLGIGTGNPIGIAGALFHMLNHAVYKSCLFFTAGNVEYRTRTSDLDKLGGLAKFMPLTYISCLIASFAISGIPPFNGFVSKWLIYQGVILQLLNSTSRAGLIFTLFCLIAALFGSALTLASFMKLLHTVFLGQRSYAQGARTIKEVPGSMWFVSLTLAGICVVFGIFAFSIPLKYFIFPALLAHMTIDSNSLPGIWSPAQASGLIIIGLVLGLIIFRLMKARLLVRKDTAFSGGALQEQDTESVVTGTDFYETVKDLNLLGRIYKRSEQGFFDIYKQGKRIFYFSQPLQILHNGVLPTYLVWILLGAAVLFFVLVR